MHYWGDKNDRRAEKQIFTNLSEQPTELNTTQHQENKQSRTCRDKHKYKHKQKRKHTYKTISPIQASTTAEI